MNYLYHKTKLYPNLQAEEKPTAHKVRNTFNSIGELGSVKQEIIPLYYGEV